MTFHSQYGRFGDLAHTPAPGADPDRHAADTMAINGNSLHPRPNLQQTLARKGFLEPSDPGWLSWKSRFSSLLRSHTTSRGSHLPARCPASWPGYAAGRCLHELTPPLHHGSLRWFCQQVSTLPDNVVVRADGSTGVDPSAKPTWIYVITNDGEIVTGREDYGVIKHSCLAGGLDVWSAGQMGIENGELRLVDLSSGHYVRPNILQGSADALALMQFTRDVFLGQASTFGLLCLHNNFDCTWS